jgi:TatD DNase family protein
MLIDVHAHLDKYDDPIETVIEEIELNQIYTISDSMDIPSFERSLEIAEKCKLILPAFGVHPWNASEYIDRLKELDEPINQTLLIGEIGLDYYFITDKSAYPAQNVLLEYFLRKAVEQNKIVCLHTKSAEKDTLNLLKKYNVKRAIIHWYSGPLDILRELIDLGYYFSIGVEVIRSEAIQAIAREIPLELLLTETDNPGGWKWLTEQPGRPSILKEVIQATAGQRRMTIEAIVDRVQRNFIRLVDSDFPLPFK